MQRGKNWLESIVLPATTRLIDWNFISVQRRCCICFGCFHYVVLVHFYVLCFLLCVQKERTKMFLLIILGCWLPAVLLDTFEQIWRVTKKLGRFWWNLVRRFLNKFALKCCKRFPPHLNNVSTLPCETWNAHCALATVELLQKDTLDFIAPQLCPPDMQIWIQLITACGKYCKRRCTKHASLIWSYQRRHWQMAAKWHDPVSPLRSQSLFQFIQISDVFLYTLSCNNPTRSNQLDSNMANFGVTVEVK